MPSENETLDESPGWNAIDAALRNIYGDQEPYHVGTIISYALGGPDPIHGISAYKNSEPEPHWHIVTYGFSELWRKESSNLEVSGFGFELTYRPTCNADDTKPPNYAINFLQNLARYVFETGNCFGVGHTLPLNGPIEQGSPTRVHAACFVADPQLPPISTPNGRVEFLQIVGVTLDELDAISSWNTQAFFELRRRDDPLLLTDLARPSWMADAEFAAEVSRRTKLEGSSSTMLRIVLDCDTLSDSTRLSIQTIAVDGLKRRLLGLLPYGRELLITGQRAAAVFRPGPQTGVEILDGTVTITMRDDHLREFVASLKPHAGQYAIPGLPNAVFQVLRTEIRDQDGRITEIVE